MPNCYRSCRDTRKWAVPAPDRQLLATVGYTCNPAIPECTNRPSSFFGDAHRSRGYGARNCSESATEMNNCIAERIGHQWCGDAQRIVQCTVDTDLTEATRTGNHCG